VILILLSLSSPALSVLEGWTASRKVLVGRILLHRRDGRLAEVLDDEDDDGVAEERDRDGAWIGILRSTRHWEGWCEVNASLTTRKTKQPAAAAPFMANAQGWTTRAEASTSAKIVRVLIGTFKRYTVQDCTDSEGYCSKMAEKE
jgi:hypothetical protein